MSRKKDLLESIRKYYEAEGKGAYVDEVLANLEATKQFTSEQRIVNAFRADVEAGNINVSPEEMEKFNKQIEIDWGFFESYSPSNIAKVLGLKDFNRSEATEYIKGISEKEEEDLEVSSKISLEDWARKDELITSIEDKRTAIYKSLGITADMNAAERQEIISEKASLQTQAELKDISLQLAEVIGKDPKEIDEAYKDIAKEDRKFAEKKEPVGSVDDIYRKKEEEKEKAEEQRKRAEEQRIADEIARDASNLINNTLDVEQEEEVPTSLTEAVNLLRKYEQGKSLGFDEKKLLEGKVSNAFSNGDLSRGEFNAINNFLGNLPDVATTDDDDDVTDVVVETTEISNDWNTDGPNIISLNDKRYALFTKDGSFRSAGSEEEFNALLNGTNPDTGKPDPAWEGYEPIEKTNSIWLDFAKSENLLEDVSDDDTDTGSNAANSESQIGSDAQIEFNNVPEGAELWDIEGKLYLAYEVPGADGELYIGSSMYMIYDIVDNDLKKAGLLTADAPNVKPNIIGNKSFLDSKAVLAGNTDQLSADIDHPFASFTDTLRTQIQVAPWLADNEAIALLAEAAVEGRTVTDAEWQTTTWWKEHTQAERDWLRTYNSDPATASQLISDTQLAVQNSLQASGVSNAPDALVDWVSNKFVSGQWSEAYTSEQIGLFADPYAQGTRDTEFENYLSSTAISGVDRTTEREREVEELFNTWLGPTLGKLTDNEKAEIAGRLRDDPDYKDTLVDSLKQSRLAAFGNYTNPELTYQDIARPWRNLTTSVWGQTADETQGWWQEMVKSNDFTTAQTTLREKGLENNIAQVTQDATGALTQALGEGLATQGVNQ